MRKLLFDQPIAMLIFSALGIMAAIFHAIHAVSPSGDAPVWRHGMFIAIGLFFSWGILRRPRFFGIFLGMLTAQQVFSHGGYLIRHFRETGDVHWISVGVVVLLPVCFFLYQKSGLG